MNEIRYSKQTYSKILLTRKVNMTFDDQDNSLDDLPENPWGEGETNNSKEKLRKNTGPSTTSKIQSLQSRRDTQKRPTAPGNFLDDLVEKFQEFWQQHKTKGTGDGSWGKGGKTGFFSILVAAILVVGTVWLSSGFYRVQEGELAVVLRFGEMVRISQPGLRYRLPSPIEYEIIKKVAVLNKIDGGLRGDTTRSNAEAQEQNLILTGDENMVHTNYTVLWKIKDISDFLFTLRDPEGTIRVAAESSIREILGQTTARLALTEGRETIGSKSQELLQKILDVYKAGVQIVSVQLQRVDPPVQVVQAFNDMQASLVDADRLRNEAEAYRNDKLPRARGKAMEILRAAEGYQQQIVAKVKGEVARFNSILASYRLNPEVTTRRYYLETMQKVLSQANKTIVGANIAGKAASGIVPYLNLQPGKKAEAMVAASPSDTQAHEISPTTISNPTPKKG